MMKRFIAVLSAGFLLAGILSSCTLIPGGEPEASEETPVAATESEPAEEETKGTSPKPIPPSRDSETKTTESSTKEPESQKDTTEYRSADVNDIEKSGWLPGWN